MRGRARNRHRLGLVAVTSGGYLLCHPPAWHGLARQGDHTVSRHICNPDERVAGHLTQKPGRLLYELAGDLPKGRITKMTRSHAATAPQAIPNTGHPPQSARSGIAALVQSPPPMNGSWNICL